MSDLVTWRARAADVPDRAAEVWTDPEAPGAVLKAPPDAVLDYLVGDDRAPGVLRAVLANPAVPHTVRAALAARATRRTRSAIVDYAAYDCDDIAVMVAVADAFTASDLERVIQGLQFGHHHDVDPDAARARLAAILRAFTTSTRPRCRALAAQAFPLTLGPRHRFADGAVSAKRLLADPDLNVRVALARNRHLSNLPDTADSMAVRQALLTDDQPRVRAAARRAGVHVSQSHVTAALAAAYGDTTTTGQIPFTAGDPLDDPAPAVRITAVTGGIARQDGARWARVLADPSARVRKAATTHGWWAPRFVWTALAADSDPRVRTAVAASRWAPVEVQRLLLSDADPAVAATAAARDPLSHRVEVGARVPADGHIQLPVSHSQDPNVRCLDITAVTLTLDRQHQLADAAQDDRQVRALARDRSLRRMAEDYKRVRWLIDRWSRWTDVFGLPTKAPAMSWFDEQLDAPYTVLDDADRRVRGALCLFDAVLGFVATPDTDEGRADRAVLTAPWRQVCTPPTHTEDTVYGRHSLTVRDCLTHAARLPYATVDTLLTTRISIARQRWGAARAEAVEAAPGPEQHLYAAHFLFWDVVTVAEIASGQRPTDPLLADAIWGAAATIAYREQLSPATIVTLTEPWTAAGLTLLS